MSGALSAFNGAAIFDGENIIEGHALIVRGPVFAGIVPAADIPAGAAVTMLSGGILAPGFVDVQVNGGGGVLFNDDPSEKTLETIAAAHLRLGATSILPTLITDTPDATRAAIRAVKQAMASGVAGITGLHLEGPHLSLARKGAHDPALIRPMTDEDEAVLIDAAGRLPVLMVTVAAESVAPDQMCRLAAAGVVLSLGHTDCSFAEATEAARCGVRCVTHLFNAMSQLGSREPGLVGAALRIGDFSAGLIADMVHVHPESIALAIAAKHGPGRIFLVSDAMATAGSVIDHFMLNGRRIERNGGRLTLADGTLAGADLNLSTACRNLVRIGVPAEDVLAMATSIPARAIRRHDSIGFISAGRQADFIHLDAGWTLSGIWRHGVQAPAIVR